MEKLKRSKDRKVSNSLTPNGKTARIANSFGLPAGREYSCPSATSVCTKICYAGKLEKIYPNVRASLLHNWALLKDADIDTMVELIDEMIVEFEGECEKWDAPKDFRIHWDGDFFNGTYTYAWQKVVMMHPNVRFWAYTRVESAIYSLKGLDNLSIYFSTDTDNVESAQRVQREGLPLAGLHETFSQAKDLLLALGERTAVCPEQRGQIKLEGACVACGICLKGKSNITFSITKK